MHSSYFMMRKLRTHKVILYIQDLLVNQRAEFKLGSNTPKTSAFPLYHLVIFLQNLLFIVMIIPHIFNIKNIH